MQAVSYEFWNISSQCWKAFTTLAAAVFSLAAVLSEHKRALLSCLYVNYVEL